MQEWLERTRDTKPILAKRSPAQAIRELRIYRTIGKTVLRKLIHLNQAKSLRDLSAIPGNRLGIPEHNIMTNSIPVPHPGETIREDVLEPL
jgi:hypothetical protein